MKLKDKLISFIKGVFTTSGNASKSSLSKFKCYLCEKYGNVEFKVANTTNSLYAHVYNDHGGVCKIRISDHVNMYNSCNLYIVIAKNKDLYIISNQNSMPYVFTFDELCKYIDDYISKLTTNISTASQIKKQKEEILKSQKLDVDLHQCPKDTSIYEAVSKKKEKEKVEKKKTADSLQEYIDAKNKNLPNAPLIESIYPFANDARRADKTFGDTSIILNVISRRGVPIAPKSVEKVYLKYLDSDIPFETCVDIFKTCYSYVKKQHQYVSLYTSYLDDIIGKCISKYNSGLSINESCEAVIAEDKEEFVNSLDTNLSCNKDYININGKKFIDIIAAKELPYIKERLQGDWISRFTSTFNKGIHYNEVIEMYKFIVNVLKKDKIKDIIGIVETYTYMYRLATDDSMKNHSCKYGNIKAAHGDIYDYFIANKNNNVSVLEKLKMDFGYFDHKQYINKYNWQAFAKKYLGKNLLKWKDNNTNYRKIVRRLFTETDLSFTELVHLINTTNYVELKKQYLK